MALLKTLSLTICASAIASSSIAAEMIKGQPIDKALENTNKGSC